MEGWLRDGKKYCVRLILIHIVYSKTCVKQPLSKKTEN